jgi:hypothetical protein
MLEQIDPEKFLYEYYSCDALAFLDSNEIARNAVGWCDASRLLVRPRRDLLALMLEMSDGEKMWFHIDQKMLSLIEKRRAKLGISS